MPRVVVYLRFARPRDGTQDPPAVQWDSAKERELWSMLRASSSDLDWPALARHFDVSLVYVLQQAAWLYEKELGLLRHKMSQIQMPPAGSVASPLRRLMREPAGGGNEPAAASPAASLSLDDLDESVSDAVPAPRRLLSASRITPLLAASSGSGSDSDSSIDGFLPATSELSSSFSDNSVSQSALEEALIEQVNERRRAEQGAPLEHSQTSRASQASQVSQTTL